MKEFIMTLLAVSCISTSYASDGCVTVKGNGTYIVGDSKCCPTAPKEPATSKGTNGINQPKFFRG